MQVTVVSDGPLPLGDPSGAFLGTTKEDIGKMLTDNFLNPTNAVLEQNAVVVNTGDKLVLIDTGMYDAKFTDVKGRTCVVRNIKIETGKIFSIEESELTSCSTR